jgi:type I site-specific restriction-modification system R (restriction) subunit
VSPGYLPEQICALEHPRSGFDGRCVERDKEIRATIDRAINASPSLRNKKDLIEQFVDSVSTKARVDAPWQFFVAARKAKELERIIVDEGLDAEATRAFVDNAFRDGAIPTTGTAITRILPAVSRFSKNNDHSIKSRRCWTSSARSWSAFLVWCDLV